MSLQSSCVSSFLPGEVGDFQLRWDVMLVPSSQICFQNMKVTKPNPSSGVKVVCDECDSELGSV